VKFLLPLLVVALVAVPTAAAGSESEFEGHRQEMLTVVVVHGLSLHDLPALSQRGAVGLMVPSAGPRTSAGLAFAGIVRGVLHNARLGERPNDPVLIRVQSSNSIPITNADVVIGLPPSRERANDRRYPVAVFAPGCTGVLSSSLTRVTGLVSAADVARTALGTEHRLRCVADDDAAKALHTLEQRIVVARGSTMAATVIVLTLLIAFALLLPSATLPALAAALVANLALGLVTGGWVEARLTLFAMCVLGGGVIGRRMVSRPATLGWLCVGVVSAYAVAMAVWPWALSLAPLGPELTSRFYGVSNVLETLLLVPILVATAFLARRYGALGFLLGAGLGLATIAENRLGADGGGAVAIGVAFAVLAVGLWRARPWMLAPALALAGLAVFALFNVDAATSAPDHLRGALDGGVSNVASVVAHRVPLAYARLNHQWYLVFPLVALALLVWRTRVWPASRERRALVASFSAAVVASLLVNDSPGPVTLVALASFFALEPYALHRELGLVFDRIFGLPAPRPAAAVVRLDRP
jgi:hypothetical protein